MSIKDLFFKRLDQDAIEIGASLTWQSSGGTSSVKVGVYTLIYRRQEGQFADRIMRQIYMPAIKTSVSAPAIVAKRYLRSWTPEERERIMFADAGAFAKAIRERKNE